VSEAHAAFGMLLVLGLALIIAIVARSRRPLSLFGNLVLAAVALRVLGGLLRHFVITDYYHGYGDAIRYHVDGLAYAEALWDFDMDRFFDLATGGQWWGTQFLLYVSGVSLAIIGPTLRGEFVFFSLIGLVGCFAFATAYTRSGDRHSKVVVRDYVWLLCLWPSMWFWPSSIGKEAILLCGLGIAVLGYVGNRGHIRWIPFAAGTLLTFSIRPHVAAVFIASVLVAEWFGGGRRWTVARTFQAFASVVLFVFIVKEATAQFGFEVTDLEGANEFFQFRAGQTQAGGSEITSVGGGPLGVIMAYVNILFRPFLFEAHNVMSLFSAVEVTALWVFAFRRRRRIAYALRNWKKDRFLRIGVPMTLLYVLMIGLTFSNLGIIARQRVLVMPFLFALLVGKRPVAKKVAATEPKREPSPQTSGRPRLEVVGA